MKMPWGKYAGNDIQDLPSGYLRWLAENIEEITLEDSAICKAADEEYQFREKNNCHVE